MSLNRVLVGLVLLALLPAAAQAQWATAETEHDWTLQLGRHRFGLVQTLHFPGERRTTQIFLGPRAVETSLRANAVAALTLISAIALVVGSAAGDCGVKWQSRANHA